MPLPHIMNHQLYMRRCLDLALNGSGYVAPNPMVGAVLVYEGRIISEGWHMKFGGPHAEVNAIRNLRDPSLLPKCTLYVSLEPCSHFGKTPPCSDLIIASGIKKVVVCNADPNPLVSGRGIAKLKAAGIEVSKGVLDEEGKHLNRRFFIFHQRKRPYIILKWAQSADGLLAPFPRKNSTGITWLSHPLSRNLTHNWRAEEASILVGANTVQNDNPQLTVRGLAGNNPVRIIMDPDLICDTRKKVFSGSGRVIIFNNKKSATVKNATYIAITQSKYFLKSAMQYLYDNGIQSVFAEGGAFTLKSFIKDNLWDEARVFRTPAELSEGIEAPKMDSSPQFTTTVLTDQLDYYFNKQ